MQDFLVILLCFGFLLLIPVVVMILTGVPAGVAVRKVFDWVFGPEPGRKAARELGFKVRDVWRLRPTIDDGKLVSLDKERCMQYTLVKPQPGARDWSLLQRFPEKDAKLPNGFIVTGDNVTADLVKKLKPLAEKFGYEYYEFERRGDSVSVFWWETDETKEVKKLHRALSELEA